MLLQKATDRSLLKPKPIHPDTSKEMTYNFEKVTKYIKVISKV